MGLDIMGWIVAPFIFAMLYERGPMIARSMVRLSARLTSEELRADRAEEWLADLEAIEGGSAWKLYHALGIVMRFGIPGASKGLVQYWGRFSPEIFGKPTPLPVLIVAFTGASIYVTLDVTFLWDLPSWAIVVFGFVGGTLTSVGHGYIAGRRMRKAEKAATKKADEEQ